MQIIMRNDPNAGYENEDIIRVVPDDHQWGISELNSANFTIQTGITVTEEESSLLEMTDEAPINVSAISKLPTFRSKMTGYEEMKTLHRRKYQYNNNAVSLKTNAQSRI